MSGRARRSLHPVAWWLWALSLGAATLRTTNPLLLALLVASAWFVVAARRPAAPWALSFNSFLKIGVAVIVLRVVFEALFGARVPGHVLLRLPSVALPDWLAGVSLGGPVSAPSVVAALQQGCQLAALLACVGAANSLASPYRLLRSMPAVLYELGVVVTVGLTFAPQAVLSATRVREARRLRGRPHRGLRGLRGLAIPVLEGALEHSLQLAASMDSRGYGRRGPAAPARRRAAQAAALVGALAGCLGAYGILDNSVPAAMGAPALVVGAALLAGSLAVGDAGSARTRYRPDPWALPEWATLVAGLAALAGLVLAANLHVAGLRPPTSPLRFPTLPVLPALAILCATIPAFAAPEPR